MPPPPHDTRRLSQHRVFRQPLKLIVPLMLLAGLALAPASTTARSQRTQVVNPGEGVSILHRFAEPVEAPRASIPNARGLKARVTRHNRHRIKLRIEASPRAPAGLRRIWIKTRHHRDQTLPIYVPYRLPDSVRSVTLTAGKPTRIELPDSASAGPITITTASPCVLFADGQPQNRSRHLLLRGASGFYIASLNNRKRHACQARIQERLDNRYDGRAHIATRRFPVRPDPELPTHLEPPRLLSVTPASSPRLRWREDPRANDREIVIRKLSEPGAPWQSITLDDDARLKGLKAGDYEWKVRVRHRQTGGLLETTSEFSPPGRFHVLPGSASS